MSREQELSRSELLSPETTIVPMCMDPLTARMCESLGFSAGYVSGGALGYSLAVSEALITLTELVDVTAAITRRSRLPMLVDVNVGFGDAVHLARVVWELEGVGAIGIEVEDQVAPKRVSHHRGIEHLIPAEDMVAKIEVAVRARSDENFLVIARTGAVANEGFDAAIARGRLYAAAGADVVMLFPSTPDDLRRAPGLLGCPVATIEPMSFMSQKEWSEFGYALVIDAYTGLVVPFQALRAAYQAGIAGRPDQMAKDQLLATYRELPGFAGLEELYEIEDQTTERGAAPNPAHILSGPAPQSVQVAGDRDQGGVSGQ